MGRNESDEDTVLLDEVLKNIFKKCLIFCSSCKLFPLNNEACNRKSRNHVNSVETCKCDSFLRSLNLHLRSIPSFLQIILSLKMNT